MVLSTPGRWREGPVARSPCPHQASGPLSCSRRGGKADTPGPGPPAATQPQKTHGDREKLRGGGDREGYLQTCVTISSSLQILCPCPRPPEDLCLPELSTETPGWAGGTEGWLHIPSPLPLGCRREVSSASASGQPVTTGAGPGGVIQAGAAPPDVPDWCCLPTGLTAGVTCLPVTKWERGLGHRTAERTAVLSAGPCARP
ncbi:uncharacterized protein LOC132540210 [Erinaceus europaeus]|uniref:Uncharacterized protein LOC132540210 n=1 Tax=Erinaceus europaeus TaxID=9365 RepID=A0ABM3XVX0_ERIEU|nr:uncharacterized protein LOC132540210 [Erinaceus europaeus]